MTNKPKSSRKKIKIRRKKTIKRKIKGGSGIRNQDEFSDSGEHYRQASFSPKTSFETLVDLNNASSSSSIIVSEKMCQEKLKKCREEKQQLKDKCNETIVSLNRKLMNEYKKNKEKTIVYKN